MLASASRQASKFLFFFVTFVGMILARFAATGLDLASQSGHEPVVAISPYDAKLMCFRTSSIPYLFN